ncbi:MAG: ankyrin repeat domain-containing protein [Sedimentisphaerales bacterium]|nr:ankyrin repeat domain-containing protein [Sedimentisphaerales bacterium]
MAVVADTCITIDDFKDYISVEDSRNVESYMLSATRKYLENIGYQVSEQYMPFVGGSRSSQVKVAVKKQKKAKIEEIPAPYFIEEGLRSDADYQAALERVIQNVLQVVQQKEKSPEEIFKLNSNVQEDLQLIRERLQTRYGLFVIGDGKIVSGITSFTQAMVTGMATGLLTGGMFIYSACEVSYLDTYVAIIDLTQADLLWCNSMRLQSGEVLGQNYYSSWDERIQTYSGWVRNMLFYIPVKGDKLIEAAKKGQNDLLEWMILTGADVNTQDQNLMTPLHLAVKDNHFETVKFLVEKGANINAQDVEDKTPLHYAVQNEQLDTVKFLLKKKAKADVRDKNGETALDIASRNQNRKIIKLLD